MPRASIAFRFRDAGHAGSIISTRANCVRTAIRTIWNGRTFPGQGEIYSYTIARKPAGPVFAADVPYVIAMIALDEGPRMLTNIVTKDVEQVAIGDRVSVFFDDVTAELTLPKFTLDKD